MPRELARHFRSGSKCEILRLSGCLPLFLQERTLVEHVPFSVFLFRRSNVMERMADSASFPIFRMTCH